jgi:phosphoribosylglycinamide formyltransferase-1
MTSRTPVHRLAIFASGSGTNAEAIIRYFKNHASVAVVAVFSNKPDAYVLERAQKHGIPAFVFTRQQLYQEEGVLRQLLDLNVTHIVLAGFLWLIPSPILTAYRGRIINIHPALLPKFGGKGMYGMHVHRAVQQAGEKETGITIHLVNERYDEGKILLQARIPLSGSETAEEIAQKVHELEYRHYAPVIEKWVQNS